MFGNGRKRVPALLQISPRYLPFADAVTAELPLGRLLRLSLFQVSVGMAIVLLNGTLNRVMIVELGVPTWLVSTVIALPLVFAPARVLIGHRSDNHRSVLGWRRVPYIWMGTLLQFGGFAIMPFALLVLSGDTLGPTTIGQYGAPLAFLLVGAGLHTTQTAGLALATDIAPEASRPRVVALLYVMLLAGMIVSALLFGALLADFDQVKLIRVIQAAAVITIALNVVALWKQEARNPALTAPSRTRPSFYESWSVFRDSGRSVRLLVAVSLGAAGFGMQDVLLEPYGGEVLNLSVSATTVLTALLAGGTLIGFWIAAQQLSRGMDPHRLAGYGALVGLVAFVLVIFAAPTQSPFLFRIGTVLIGLGTGLFAVGTLIAAMNIAAKGASGFALGAWGAAQATAAGLGIALGGVLRDTVTGLAADGVLGATLVDPATGYSVVYGIEAVLLLATLIAIGPLASHVKEQRTPSRIGLSEFPS